MQIRKHNKIQKAIIFALFLVLLFFCRGGSLGMAFSPRTMAMGPMTSDHAMPCCDIKLPLSGMAHNMAIMSVSMRDLLRVIISVLVGLFVYILVRQVGNTNAGSLYVKKITCLYGSWRRFILSVHLFRRGLLHPKIW